RRHAEFVRVRERFGHFHNFPVGVGRPEVDGGAHRYGAHVICLLDGAEHDLRVGARVRHELVVVDLHDERDLVSVLARHGAEYAEGGSDRVATALHGEFDDLLGIEVVGVLGEGGAAGVLDSLVYGQYGNVTGVCEAAVTVQRLQAAQHP